MNGKGSVRVAAPLCTTSMRRCFPRLQWNPRICTHLLPCDVLTHALWRRQAYPYYCIRDCAEPSDALTGLTNQYNRQYNRRYDCGDYTPV